MTTILKEMYSKCLALENDISQQISKDQKDFWRKKAEYFIASRKNLNKRLEDCIYNIKKKNQRNKFNFDDDNNLELGENINNLEREKQSLSSTLRMSSEIESKSLIVNDELSNQLLSLGNIGEKINQIFHKMTGSYRDSSWIKQRGQNDKYLCLALGCLTIFIIGFTYLYLRPKLRGK